MDAQTMLRILGEDGENAGSDFNDAHDVMGWFGWSIADNVLTVTYEASDRTPGEPQVVTRRWRLTEEPG
jgi:hypothetical protein